MMTFLAGLVVGVLVGMFVVASLVMLADPEGV
jgi:hypothetical protein